MANENLLWFEFLLHPTLLEQHLANPKPDPSPIDLIAKFLGLDLKNDFFLNESEKIERDFPSDSFKAVALKILTMKVMAYLDWDLDALELKLNPKIIMQLLLDLLSMAKQEEVKSEQDFLVEYKCNMNHQTLFAVHLYHRWVLKAVMHNSLIWKHPRMLFLSTQGVQDPSNLVLKKREDFRIMLENHEIESISILGKMIAEVDTLTIPTVQSFIQPTEASSEVNTKWKGGKLVSSTEFKCQLHFELATFLLFRRNHEAAHSHLKDCLRLYEQLPSLNSSSGFCRIDKEILYGLACACDVPLNEAPRTSLIERFRQSKWNHYQDIILILQTDNLLREIPLAERDLVEVELQQAIGGGSLTVAKDLLMKLQVLNALRRIMSQVTPSIDILLLLNNCGEKSVDFFLTSIHSVMFDVPEKEQRNLHRYLFNLLVRAAKSPFNVSLVSVVLADEEIRSRFTQSELDYISNVASGQTTLPALTLAHVLPSTYECSRLEIISIQHKLGESFDPNKIRGYLQALIKADPTKPWFRCNSRWEVHIPLQSAILSLPKGFFQDFIYILLAKSKELSTKKEYCKAMSLLEVADMESKGMLGCHNLAIQKLRKLISWEALLLNINQYIYKYPKYSQDINILKASCKACLSATSAGESVIPRLEVMESCVIALLNLCQWEFLMTMDKRLIYMEFAAALASACQELTKNKGTRKLPREAWDLILPVFGSTAQKRNSAGTALSAGGTGLTKSFLIGFLLQLRESTVIMVITSLLSRMHNVLRDEPTLEINCIHTGLWPAMISNCNFYSYKVVSEVLYQLTTQTLTFMPNNFAILKLMGDLSYASTDWTEALRRYLEAIAVGSDYFSQPIVKPVIDDFIIKRLIRCCTQLNCNTQAAVLCQCLEDIDYSTAFRCLADTKNLQCADGMDAYYPCIWDITILEYLVNLHSKRGETQRKNQVVKIMGLLELNSNNHEEIQNEAAKIRKNRLMRALLQQYCVSNQTVIAHLQKAD